mmetsp:Transcript_9319/g.23249  ORF Transcript_9319/g.23249 Transcript_9319/m.23249 type:complete len:88 (-) Transcript_9319:70-333(-)
MPPPPPPLPPPPPPCLFTLASSCRYYYYYYRQTGVRARPHLAPTQLVPRCRTGDWPQQERLGGDVYVGRGGHGGGGGRAQEVHHATV